MSSQMKENKILRELSQLSDLELSCNKFMLGLKTHSILDFGPGN